jgi:Phage ABA sandwich domain
MAKAVEEMKAGRELDALIAEKVLGCQMYTVKRHDGVVIRYRCDCAKGTPEAPLHSDDFIEHTIKLYSSDVCAAWELVEAMRKLKLKIILETSGSEYSCIVSRTIQDKAAKGYYHGYVMAYGDTAPLTICRAALCALAGEEVEEG